MGGGIMQYLIEKTLKFIFNCFKKILILVIRPSIYSFRDIFPFL